MFENQRIPISPVALAVAPPRRIPRPDPADETAASWRDHLHDMLKSMVGNTAAGFNIDHIDEAAWRGLTEEMLYVRGDLAMPELYEKLRDAINEVRIADGVPRNVIFYLAIADRFFGVVADQLGNAN